MISLEKVKELCEPPGEGKAYFRPMLCKGELSKVDIFLVGTNPATPIYPKDMRIERFVELILSYEEFINYYKSSRLASGKGEVSRTRTGMNSFLDWLSQHTSSSIVETEVIPYPTEKLKLLKKEPKFVIERGKEIFYELVTLFEPKTIILHGKTTVEEAVDIFERKGLISSNVINLEESIEQMEASSPIQSFVYPSGKSGTILACRHFMYYGRTGNSFSAFRQKVLANL